MAGHQLIEAELAELRRRLPPDLADELADGLTETYAHRLSLGDDPEAAAAATINEFGDADRIVIAFVRQAPGRRAALALLATGPLIGACWAAVLVLGRAWTWPVPIGWRISFGVVLLATITVLAIAGTARDSYRRTTVAVPAALAVLVLDLALVGTALLAAPAPIWPMLVAVPASLIRSGLTSRTLPGLLGR